MIAIRQALAAVLWIALAGTAAAQDLPRVDDPQLVALAAEAHAACSSPNSLPSENRYQLLTDARVLAGLESRFKADCTRRSALALRIARALAARRSPDAPGAYRVLGEFAERGIGTAPDARAAREYRRRAWAIGGRDVLPIAPFASTAERDAYLARPRTIAFLRIYAGVPRLPVARVRLAQALLARGRPGDRMIALSLIGEAALGFEPEAELVQARAWLAQTDAADRRRGVASLRRLAVHPENGGEARAILSSLARRTLGSDRAEDRFEAIRSLAAVAIGGGASDRQDLLLAVTAANGGMPPGFVTGTAAEPLARTLRPGLLDDDYPAAALRGQEQGVIALRGLIDPRGQLIYTEAARVGQSARLVAALRRIYARRTIPAADIGTARSTPYMWVDLAPVTFTYESRLRGTVRLPF